MFFYWSLHSYNFLYKLPPPYKLKCFVIEPANRKVENLVQLVVYSRIYLNRFIKKQFCYLAKTNCLAFTYLLNLEATQPKYEATKVSYTLTQF